MLFRINNGSNKFVGYESLTSMLKHYCSMPGPSRNNVESLVGLSYIERPILGDNPKAHKVDNEKCVPFVKSVHFS